MGLSVFLIRTEDPMIYSLLPVYFFTNICLFLAMCGIDEAAISSFASPAEKKANKEHMAIFPHADMFCSHPRLMNGIT